LERWLARVRARDPFGAPGGHHVDVRLTQARAKLEAFAEQVQRQEHSESGGSAIVPKSDAVAEQAGSVMAPESTRGAA